jgi:chromosome segregation ATPase
MPKIEAPVEMGQALARVKELEARVKELEDVATENANIVQALTEENDSLKEATASEDTRAAALAKINSELANENEALAKDLEKVIGENASLDTHVQSLEIETERLSTALAQADSQLAAFTELASNAKQTSDDVQEQNKLISEHLQIRSQPPDIEEVSGQDSASASKLSSYSKRYFALAKTDDPEEKMERRRIYNQNKSEIDAEISRKDGSRKPMRVDREMEGISDSEMAIYADWQDQEKTAAEFLAPFSGLNPVDKHRKHAEAKVEARKFYNLNRPTIDKVIAAQSRAVA